MAVLGADQKPSGFSSEFAPYLIHSALQKSNWVSDPSKPVRIFPSVGDITNVTQSGLTIKFDLKLRLFPVYPCLELKDTPADNATIKPSFYVTGLERTNNLTLLGEEAARVFRVSLKTKDSKQTIPLRSTSFTPSVVGTNDTVLVEVALASAPAKGETVVLGANTYVGDAVSEVIRTNLIWLKNASAELISRLDGKKLNEQDEIKKALEVFRASSQKAKDPSGPPTRSFRAWRELIKPIVTSDRYKTDTDSPALLAEIRGDECSRQDPMNDATTVFLISEFDALSASWNTLDKETKRAADLLVLMAHRIENLEISLSRRRGDETTGGFAFGDSVEFKWKNIIGFTQFTEKIQQVPHKDVEVNLGKGIADHFIVLELHFQNKTTNKVLIYGDGIEIPCYALGLSYTNSYSYRRLLEINPRRIDITLDDPNCHGAPFSWKAPNPRHFGPTAQGNVDSEPHRIMVRPVPLSFMRSGHVRREANTTKARAFRAAQFAGAIAAAVIPVARAGQAFSESAALYGDVLIPSVRTLLGDSSEVQRQAFENESLDQYLELEVGQSCHKLIYLPRNGVDQLAPNRILFIDGVTTNAQEISIHAALIKAETE